MPSLTGLTGLVFGSGIPLSGLTVYYDFSNPNCYPGSGTTINNLASYSNIAGNLSGSLAGGTPAFTLDGSKSYISFVSSSEQYMYYTIPTFGPSFTNISIYASPTSAWDGEGDIGGARWGHEGLSATTSNGFVQQAYPGPSTTTQAVEYVPVSPGYVNYTDYGFPTPSSITTPHFYFHGYDNSNGYYMTGYDNAITETTSVPPLANRATKNDTKVYFSRLDPRQAGAFGPRFTSTKIYLHMLYNRKLSISELTLIYKSLKNRFNF